MSFLSEDVVKVTEPTMLYSVHLARYLLTYIYKKLPIKQPGHLFQNKSFCIGACLDLVLNWTSALIKKVNKNKKSQAITFFPNAQNSFQNSLKN